MRETVTLAMIILKLQVVVTEIPVPAVHVQSLKPLYQIKTNLTKQTQQAVASLVISFSLAGQRYPLPDKLHTTLRLTVWL